MAGILLGISCIALFAYGYWLMARLDHFVDHMDRRRTARAGHHDTSRGRLTV